MKDTVAVQGGRVKYGRKSLAGYLIFARDILSDREIRVVEARLSGDTLEEVAIALGVHKERIRQIEAKALAKTNQKMHRILKANERMKKQIKELRAKKQQELPNPLVDPVPLEEYTDHFSARTANALANNEIHNVVQLYDSFTTRELLDFRGIGTNGYEECVGLLKHLGLIHR